MKRVFLLALVFFLTACASTPVGTPVTSSTTTPRVSTTAAPSSVLVNYERTGGFAGMSDHLVIDSDGHATLTRRGGAKQFDLSRDELSQLQAVFQSAGFATLPGTLMPTAVPPDAFTYVITYQGHRVKTADSAVPQSLQPVLDALNRFL